MRLETLCVWGRAAGRMTPGSIEFLGLVGSRSQEGGRSRFQWSVAWKPGEHLILWPRLRAQALVSQWCGRAGVKTPVRSSLREPDGGLGADSESACPPQS